MNWGKWIILAFVLFAGLVTTLVTVSMREDVSLVSESYYQDELAYQEVLDRKNNTLSLTNKPVISIRDQRLEVYFPGNMIIDSGEIKLFRSSDKSLDQTFMLNAGQDSIRVFALKPVKPGPYRVKFSWSMNHKEYYLEKLIVI